jgi:hypothetical protein
VHVNSDVFRNHLLHKRNELFGHLAQHDPRIGGRVDVGEREDEIGRGGDPPQHRQAKELLFRAHVPQHCRSRHSHLGCDVGQRGPLEPLYCKHRPGGFKKFLAADARRPAHL